MKILFTGRGTSGSWAIRGLQLSQAMGADAVPVARQTDADIIVIVKRVDNATLAAMHGRYLVWDIVDSWPQPGGNNWDYVSCQRWLESEVNRIKPNALIAATKRMADDCKRFGLPVLWLPHHHRPGIERNPIRKSISVVGYEGAPNYIIPWLPRIRKECQKIGAVFVQNPMAIAECDVVLALRDSVGYAPRNYKSGVKLQNAQASGTPFIGCRERGYLEIATGGEFWADTGEELAHALTALASQQTRQEVALRLLKGALNVDQAANRLRVFLNEL